MTSPRDNRCDCLFEEEESRGEEGRRPLGECVDSLARRRQPQLLQDFPGARARAQARRAEHEGPMAGQARCVSTDRSRRGCKGQGQSSPTALTLHTHPPLLISYKHLAQFTNLQTIFSRRTCAHTYPARGPGLTVSAFARYIYRR